MALSQGHGEYDAAEPGNRPVYGAAHRLLRREPNAYGVTCIEAESPVEPDAAAGDATDAGVLDLAVCLQQREAACRMERRALGR